MIGEKLIGNKRLIATILLITLLAGGMYFFLFQEDAYTQNEEAGLQSITQVGFTVDTSTDKNNYGNLHTSSSTELMSSSYDLSNKNSFRFSENAEWTLVKSRSPKVQTKQVTWVVYYKDKYMNSWEKILDGSQEKSFKYGTIRISDPDFSYWECFGGACQGMEEELSPSHTLPMDCDMDLRGRFEANDNLEPGSGFALKIELEGEYRYSHQVKKDFWGNTEWKKENREGVYFSDEAYIFRDYPTYVIKTSPAMSTIKVELDGRNVVDEYITTGEYEYKPESYHVNQGKTATLIVESIGYETQTREIDLADVGQTLNINLNQEGTQVEDDEDSIEEDANGLFLITVSPSDAEVVLNGYPLDMQTTNYNNEPNSNKFNHYSSGDAWIELSKSSYKLTENRMNELTISKEGYKPVTKRFLASNKVGYDIDLKNDVYDVLVTFTPESARVEDAYGTNGERYQVRNFYGEGEAKILDVPKGKSVTFKVLERDHVREDCSPKYETREVKITGEENLEKHVDLDLNTNPVNNPPIATTPRLSGNNILEMGEPVFFNFDFFDQEGDEIEKIEIDWGDDQTEILRSFQGRIEHVFRTPGEYKIKARAYDGHTCANNRLRWGSWSDYLTVEIERGDKPPTVELQYPDTGDTGAKGVPYAFKAKGFDVYGDDLQYVFLWGDGTETHVSEENREAGDWGRLCEKTHIYDSMGEYTVTVKITDGTHIVEDSLDFTIKKMRLPEPEISGLYVRGKGETATAIVEIDTKIPEHLFQLVVDVEDAKGSIYTSRVTDKIFSGKKYLSTVSFDTNNNGEVTFKAKCIPTQRSQDAFYDSRTASKTDTCIGMPEFGEERLIDNPVIRAINVDVGEQTRVDVIVETNFDEDEFDIYASAYDSTSDTLQQWEVLPKNRTDISEYVASFYYTCETPGRITIQAQAIVKENQFGTQIVKDYVQCGGGDSLDYGDDSDWDELYERINESEQPVHGQLYDASKNTEGLPGFTTVILIAIISALIIFAVVVFLRRRNIIL